MSISKTPFCINRFFSCTSWGIIFNSSLPLGSKVLV